MANGKNALKVIRGLWKQRLEYDGFDKAFEKIDIISVGAGKCVAEIVVSKEHTNFRGMLHGGASSTLIDIVSTLGLKAEKGSYGVTVDLSLMYLKSAHIGDEIIIDATTIKAGQTLAFLLVDIRNKKTGELLVQGKHTKLIRKGSGENISS